MDSKLVRPLVLNLFFTVAFTSASAETLKLATWNIEHLRDGIAEGPNPRTDADFERLASYAKMLRADVIAFQEVENLDVASKVFNPAVYQLFISERDAHMRTGFAVRQGLAVSRNSDLVELNVSGFLRHGTDITLTVGDTPIRLLSVHLKSGCWEGPLDAPHDACEKLKRQLPVLEAWIDARAAEGTPFIVLGDFNRRFDAPDDEFWQEIDDGKPRNADLRYVTRGETQLCWDREFILFIDHIVFDRLSARWIRPYTFEQLIYQEPTAFKKQLSDHCPIAVSVRVP